MPTLKPPLGIHHVSGMTANAAGNLHFYTQVLGLRLVKKTVNQDDTSAYHLFYGDEIGNAGSEVTFFDIPQLGRNQPGVSSISNIALRVPDEAALEYWQQRFSEHKVKHDPIALRAGRPSLRFEDPEGQSLQLVSDNTAPSDSHWHKSPVPQAAGIKGLGPVALTLREASPSAMILEQLLGFEEQSSYADPSTGHTVRVFANPEGGAASEVHLHERPDLPLARLGRGGMHHVAFRVPDEESYQAWLSHLQQAGIPNSGAVDRYYFRSIYFREPNGILYELATDGPGFATDEDPAHLGERLALPPFLEPQRAAIEAKLQPLDTH